MLVHLTSYEKLRSGFFRLDREFTGQMNIEARFELYFKLADILAIRLTWLNRYEGNEIKISANTSSDNRLSALFQPGFLRFRRVSSKLFGSSSWIVELFAIFRRSKSENLVSLFANVGIWITFSDPDHLKFHPNFRLTNRQNVLSNLGIRNFHSAAFLI